MDPDVARLVLTGITFVGVVVWLIGLQFLIGSARRRETGQPDDAREVDFAGEERDGCLTGSAEVEGKAPTLASRAATILVQGNVYTLGPVRINEKTDDHIQFERVAAANQAAGPWFGRGELRFTPLASGRTRVEWAVEPGASRALLWAGALFQVLGLIALVVGCWVIFTFVTSSPNPAVRWQTVQMVQVVHFLWPPFLFGAMYRKGTRLVEAQLAALVNNLRYYET
jgi:hypothetical protein